jgi:hypothetical protein
MTDSVFVKISGHTRRDAKEGQESLSGWASRGFSGSEPSAASESETVKAMEAAGWPWGREFAAHGASMQHALGAAARAGWLSHIRFACPAPLSLAG